MYSKAYNINFVGLEKYDLKSVVQHLKTQYEMIVVETGINHVEQYYMQEDVLENPIDMFMLSIFAGPVDSTCVGPPLPLKTQISQTFYV